LNFLNFTPDGNLKEESTMAYEKLSVGMSRKEYILKQKHKMNNKLPMFKKFAEGYSQKKIEESSVRISNKLKKATEEYHEAQIKLQQLQKEFIGIGKEDKVKREELKKAIISQNAIVKQKEALFNKSLGDEDIEDFEI
jgi:hypothetical protein